MGGDLGSSGWQYKLKRGWRCLVLPQRFGSTFSLSAAILAVGHLLRMCPRVLSTHFYLNFCLLACFRWLSSFNLVVVCFGVHGRTRIYVSSQPPWVSEVTKEMSPFQCFQLFAYSSFSVAAFLSSPKFSLASGYSSELMIFLLAGNPNAYVTCDTSSQGLRVLFPLHHVFSVPPLDLFY